VNQTNDIGHCGWGLEVHESPPHSCSGCSAQEGVGGKGGEKRLLKQKSQSAPRILRMNNLLTSSCNKLRRERTLCR
jgi:hypothetical protein